MDFQDVEEWVSPNGRRVTVGEVWNLIDKRKGGRSVKVVGIRIERDSVKVAVRDVVTDLLRYHHAAVFVARFERLGYVIERCSCAESMHLRAALQRIVAIGTESVVTDIARRGLTLQRLDPEKP